MIITVGESTAPLQDTPSLAGQICRGNRLLEATLRGRCQVPGRPRKPDSAVQLSHSAHKRDCQATTTLTFCTQVKLSGHHKPRLLWRSDQSLQQKGNKCISCVLCRQKMLA